MNTDGPSSAARHPPAVEKPRAANLKRTKPPNDEPRPLGAKRAALHRRRLNAAARKHRTTTSPSASNCVTFDSNDGATSFELCRLPSGVLLNRTQQQLSGARLMQCMVFADSRTFSRWCECESIRFEEPNLFDQLCRAGHAALAGKR